MEKSSEESQRPQSAVEPVMMMSSKVVDKTLPIRSVQGDLLGFQLHLWNHALMNLFKETRELKKNGLLTIVNSSVRSITPIICNKLNCCKI